MSVVSRVLRFTLVAVSLVLAQCHVYNPTPIYVPEVKDMKIPSPEAMLTRKDPFPESQISDLAWESARLREIQRERQLLAERDAALLQERAMLDRELLSDVHTRGNPTSTRNDFWPENANRFDPGATWDDRSGNSRWMDNNLSDRNSFRVDSFNPQSTMARDPRDPRSGRSSWDNMGGQVFDQSNGRQVDPLNSRVSQPLDPQANDNTQAGMVVDPREPLLQRTGNFRGPRPNGRSAANSNFIRMLGERVRESVRGGRDSNSPFDRTGAASGRNRRNPMWS